MEKTFVVYAGPDICVAVNAESEEQAFERFAENRIMDETFRDHVDHFIVNFSLLEEFYSDDKGFLLDEDGEFKEHILKIENDKECIKYINNCIENNVKKFWSDAPQFAEEYMREYRNNKNIDFYETNFSREFYIDTFKRVVALGDWYDDLVIKEIDLSTRDVQVIFNK
ncbi:hypothetical protein ACFVRR_12330 [Gottfriedia sp. NPDC057948]|uniref:hypothetical protein n=1 Tax=Gottfriedia sp. NPDC057948 TaxID=3346287 RepID=UPI0036DBE4B0